MTPIVGGIRSRLIRDSIYHCLYDSLDALGWFDTDRRHRPIVFTGRSYENDEEIQLNTISLSDEDLSEFPLELGSTAAEIHWDYWIDFYAEDDSIGKHLINDVRDILGGRMAAIDRDDSSVAVLDYRLATPVPVFSVQIEDLAVQKAHNFPKPFQRHWYGCSFTVFDYYTAL